MEELVPLCYQALVWDRMDRQMVKQDHYTDKPILVLVEVGHREPMALLL